MRSQLRPVQSALANDVRLDNQGASPSQQQQNQDGDTAVEVGTSIKRAVLEACEKLEFLNLLIFLN